MAAAVRQDRSATFAALAIAVLLHAAVLAIAAILAARQPQRMGDVTTVTLVNAADMANLRSAEQAPQTTSAATPTPTPEAPHQAAPPPAATPAPAPPTPALKPTKPQPSFDIQNVANDVANTRTSTPAHPSSAKAGAAHAQTAPVATTGTGQGSEASAADVANLKAALERAWILNCDDLGGADINFDMSFGVGPTGLVTDLVSTGDASASATVRVNSRRAKDALHKLEPLNDFRGLRRHVVKQIHFNAKEACARR